MKFSLNGKPVIELSETQKRVIQNDILIDIFESDMQRRAFWSVDYPCRNFCDRRRTEFVSKCVEKGHTTVPVDNLKLACVDKDLSRCCEHKISVNDREVVSFSKEHDSVIRDHILEYGEPEDFMCAQIYEILMHKYQRCMQRLRAEWEPKLVSRGIQNVPIVDDEFALLVFSQKDYKNRSEREFLSKDNLAAVV